MDEHHKYLWDTFCEFYAGWVSHVQSVEKYSDNKILVIMKEDGYTTSGFHYIFGDNGPNKWYMKRIEPSQ